MIQMARWVAALIVGGIALLLYVLAIDGNTHAIRVLELVVAVVGLGCAALFFVIDRRARV